MATEEEAGPDEGGNSAGGSNTGGQLPAYAQTDSVVWLVHGTFAGIPSSNGEPKAWWEEASDWSEELKDRLRGLANGPRVEIRSFQWPDPAIGPGPNRETARRDGGEKLARLLEEFEDKDRRPYHLIGHSHGGSVIWHALVESAKRMREDPNKGLRGLRTWTTIGTPFIEFRTAWNELRGPALALFFAFVLLAGWLATYWGELPGDIAELRQIWNHPQSVVDRAPSKLWEQATSLISARTAVRVTVFMLAFFLVRYVVNLTLLHIGLLLSGWNLFRNLTSLALATFGMSVVSAYVLGGSGLTERRALMALGFIAAAALAAILVWVGYNIYRLLLLHRDDARRARHEALAAKEYGRKWLGLSHPDDEAIALLSAALLEAPSLRPQQVSGASRRVPWLETIVRPIFDEATWRTLTQFALGDDREGLTVARIGRAPKALQAYNRVLEPGAIAGISQSADKAVGEMFAKMRARLRVFNNASAKGDIEALVREISFNGVIHTSYFLGSANNGLSGTSRDFPLMGFMVQWIARLPEHAALKLKFVRLPPVASPSQLRDTEVTANRGRFARLNGLTVAVWVGVVTAAAATTATLVSVAVLPYTHASQYHAAERATEQDPFLLNMSDAPLAGAYAVHLAALGRLSDEDSIWRLLRRISQANTNSVVSQRLAFAYRLAGNDHLADVVQKYAVGNYPHHVRRAHIITLAGLYGKLMGGRPLTEQDRRAANLAWIDERNGRRFIACGDTDQLAMLAIYIPLHADGARDFPKLAKDLKSEAAAWIQNCGQSLEQQNHDSESQARDLVAALALSSARDVFSWGRASTAQDLVRLASAALQYTSSTAANTDSMKGVFERQEQRAQTSCKAGLLMMSQRLQTDDQTNKWSEDVPCVEARKRMSKYLINSCNLNKNEPISRDCLAIFDFGDTPLRDVKALCRSERQLLLGGFRLLANHAGKECKSVGDASAAAVVAAFTLTAIGLPRDSTADLLALKPPSQLADKIASAVPNPAYGSREFESLEPSFRKLIACIADAKCKDEQAAIPSSARDYETHQRSALGRGVAWVRFLANFDAERAAEAADEMYRGLRARPDGHVTADMIVLVVDGLMNSHRPEHRRKAADLIDAALGAAPATQAPPVVNQRTTNDQQLISELLARRLAVNQAGPPLDAVRRKIDERLVLEYGQEARSAIVGMLTFSHVVAGELHAARETAARAGQRDQIISSHCRILEHKLGRNPEARKRFGLEPSRHWPQPAPTLFDVAAPFTFDRSPAGPISCAATRNYDID